MVGWHEGDTVCVFAGRAERVIQGALAPRLVTSATVSVAYSATMTLSVTQTSTAKDAPTQMKIVEFANSEREPRRAPKPTADDTP